MSEQTKSLQIKLRSFSQQAFDELQKAIDAAKTSKDHRDNAKLILSYNGIQAEEQRTAAMEGGQIATEAIMSVLSKLAGQLGAKGLNINIARNVTPLRPVTEDYEETVELKQKEVISPKVLEALGGPEYYWQPES